MESPRTQLKCWAILSRPSGTAKTVPRRCNKLRCAPPAPVPRRESFHHGWQRGCARCGPFLLGSSVIRFNLCKLPVSLIKQCLVYRNGAQQTTNRPTCNDPKAAKPIVGDGCQRNACDACRKHKQGPIADAERQPRLFAAIWTWVTTRRRTPVSPPSERECLIAVGASHNRVCSSRLTTPSSATGAAGATAARRGKGGGRKQRA